MIEEYKNSRRGEISMHFPSKKDRWTFSFFLFAIIVCILPVFMGRELKVLLFSIPLAIIFVWLWFTIGYSIENQYLIVNVGPIKSKVPVKDIKIIRKLKSPHLAPALSVDRLIIFYGTPLRMLNISPQEQQKFVSRLMSMNQEIEVDNSIFSETK